MGDDEIDVVRDLRVTQEGQDRSVARFFLVLVEALAAGPLGTQYVFHMYVSNATDARSAMTDRAPAHHHVAPTVMLAGKVYGEEPMTSDTGFAGINACALLVETVEV
jgi:hypothetical protein